MNHFNHKGPLKVEEGIRRENQSEKWQHEDWPNTANFDDGRRGHVSRKMEPLEQTNKQTKDKEMDTRVSLQKGVHHDNGLILASEIYIRLLIYRSIGLCCFKSLNLV